MRIPILIVAPHPHISEAFTAAVLPDDEVPIDLVCSDQASMALQVNSCRFTRRSCPAFAALIAQCHQFARHPPCRDRGVGDRRQTLPAGLEQDRRTGADGAPGAYSAVPALVIRP
jgi:hypothetical protein